MEYAKAVEDYLSELARRGVRPQTIQGYRRALLRFLRGRPPDAPLNWAAVAGWREQLLELGYRPRTVNVFLSAARGLMCYLALREVPPPRLTGLPEQERRICGWDGGGDPA